MKKNRRLIENQRKAIKTFNHSYHYKENTIKLNPHNTYTHELAKTKVALELLKNGSMIYTEVIFKNYSRADILEITPQGILIIEILHTETLKDFEKNKNEYPFQTIPLMADEVIEEFFKKWQTKTLY